MKQHLLLPLAALLGGAAAFCLRLWQNCTCFEPQTGLPIPGAPAGMVLAVFLLALGGLFFCLVRRLPKDTDGGPLLPADFVTEDARLLVLPVAGVLLIAAAGLADLYEGMTHTSLLTQLLTAADPYSETVVPAAAGLSPAAKRLLGLLGLVFAASMFPALSACRRGARESGEFRGAAFLLIPPIALVVRLVLVYRVNSVDPVLSAYYVELLALVFLTLAFYRLSSFAFRAGKTQLFAFYVCAAVVLSMAALADGGPDLSTLLLGVGGSAALLGFLLLRLAIPAAVAEPAGQKDDPSRGEESSGDSV